MSEKPVIFVSCGQYTESEKKLGRLIVETIKQSTSFDAYFAENQTSLNTVTENILKQLATCVALVAIMHKRGEVDTPTGRKTRGSIWIEQEIAIAAFMRQVLGRKIAVLLFTENGISREGIREQLHLNPIVFGSDDELLEHFRGIVKTWTSGIAEDLREDDVPEAGSAAPVQTDPRIEEADVSISIMSGRADNFALNVTNESDSDLEIKRVQLRYQNTDITGPGRPSSGNSWIVGAGKTMPVAWRAIPNPAERIVSMRQAQDPQVKRAMWFNATVQFRFHCRILGSSRTIEKDKYVQVDRVNNTIGDS